MYFVTASFCLTCYENSYMVFWQVRMKKRSEPRGGKHAQLSSDACVQTPLRREGPLRGQSWSGCAEPCPSPCVPSRCFVNVFSCY